MIASAGSHISARSKTRSVRSSSVSGLAAYGVPGAGGVALDGIATRTGPYDAMCSHIVDEPGPPFHTNVTGRVRASALADQSLEHLGVGIPRG